MNEKDLIELYRSQVESRNETPPESCWNEISSQLDIEETWDSISVELDKVMPLTADSEGIRVEKNETVHSGPALILSFLVLVFLFIMTDTRIQNLIPSDNKPFILQSQAPLSAKSEQQLKEADTESDVITGKKSVINNEANLLSPSLIIHEPYIIPVSDPSEQISKNRIPRIKSYTTDGLITDKSQHRPIIPDISLVSPPDQQMLQPDTGLISQLTVQDSGTPQLNNNLPVITIPPESGKMQNINRFAAGISFIEKNTWMINQETVDGLDKQSLSTTKAQFLSDFGILVRFNLNEKWAFEGSSFLLSRTGQSYNLFLNGIYITKIYKLKYYSFEMSARYALYKFPGFNFIKSYLVAGPYVSFLNSASKTINNSLSDISSDYNPTDYGLVIGSDLEIRILKRLSVAPGIRIKYGIPNIFADQPGMPGELHSTKNASLDFRLNLILPM
jgi:hypothetical protein